MLEEKVKKQKSKIAKYLILVFKLLSAIALGLCLSMIGQALIGYSYFSFMFIFLTVCLAFWALIKKLDILAVLLVDLFFVLMIFIVRVYIVISDSG